MPGPQGNRKPENQSANAASAKSPKIVVWVNGQRVIIAYKNQSEIKAKQLELLKTDKEAFQKYNNLKEKQKKATTFEENVEFGKQALNVLLYGSSGKPPAVMPQPVEPGSILKKASSNTATTNSSSKPLPKGTQGPVAANKGTYVAPKFLQDPFLASNSPSANTSAKSGAAPEKEKAIIGPVEVFNPYPGIWDSKITREDYELMKKNPNKSLQEIHANEPLSRRLLYPNRTYRDLEAEKYDRWLKSPAGGFKKVNGKYVKNVRLSNGRSVEFSYWKIPTQGQFRSDIQNFKNGKLDQSDKELGPDGVKNQYINYPVLGPAETIQRLKYLRKVLENASRQQDTSLYDEAYLEFVKRKGLSPDDTNNFNLPPRPAFDPRNVPSNIYLGYTLADELKLGDPNKNPYEDPNSTQFQMVMPHIGNGNPGEPYRDPVINWIRQNVSITGKNSQAFLFKVAEMRSRNIQDEVILNYIRDPKNFKDLQEQSAAMGGLSNNVFSKLPVIRTYMELADSIDMANQIMSSYDMRRKKGESVQEALFHIAEEIGEGAIDPIRTIVQKMQDPDLSAAGKASAIYNAFASLQTIYHGIHGAVALGKTALNSPFGTRLRSLFLENINRDYSGAEYRPSAVDSAVAKGGATYHTDDPRPESMKTDSGKTIVTKSELHAGQAPPHTNPPLKSSASKNGITLHSNGKAHGSSLSSSHTESPKTGWKQDNETSSFQFEGKEQSTGKVSEYSFDPSHKAVYEQYLKAWDEFSKTSGISDSLKKFATDSRDAIFKDLKDGRPNKAVEESVAANGGWKSQMDRHGQVLVSADEHNNLVATLRDGDAAKPPTEFPSHPTPNTTLNTGSNLKGVNSSADIGNTIHKSPEAASNIFNNIFQNDSVRDGIDIGPSFKLGNSHIDFRRPAGSWIANIFPLDRIVSELHKQVNELKLPTPLDDAERNALGKSLGVDNINSKLDSVIQEELSGAPLNPARQAYHDHLDKATENGLISPEANQKLKEHHDHQADAWSKESSKNPSDYYVDHAPQLIEGLGDEAASTGAKGKAISTRVRAKREPSSEFDIANMEALKESPEYAGKVLNEMSTYAGFERLPKNLDAYAKFLAENLVALYKLTPEKFRAKIRGTFYGANKFMARLAAQHGFTLEQISGATAVLSAGTKWEHNINNVERLIDAMAAGKAHIFDNAMEKWATAKFGPKAVERLRGKSLSDVTDIGDKAYWIQAYDRIHHENGFRVLNPDGTFSEFVMRKDGNKWSRMWNNPTDIQKAISILESTSHEQISISLGKGQKVRNFYNNLVNPWSEHGFVTTDTHMVAASLFSPLSGKDREVKAAFGTAGKAGGNDPSGFKGTNAVYMEAARLAAKELGVDPHEVQSIAWHMGKAMFDPAFKKGAGNKLAIANIWRQVGVNDFTADMARAKILELVGGVKDMPWLDAKPSGAKSSYK